MATSPGIVIPYAPRRLQLEVHGNLKRFSVLACHRRFGKTVLAVNELLASAVKDMAVKTNGRYAYIAPLYKQAKQAAWDYLKQYTEPFEGRRVNESELRVDLPFGARISLYGADNPDSLRGIYLDGVVLDEYAQMSPRLWGEVIRPALADRKGWAMFIGTPQGHNQFWDIYEAARNDPDWYSALFKASETGIVAAEELEAARKAMTPEEYEQEFECSFIAAVRGAYYGKLLAEIDEKGQIGNVPYEKNIPVETWWDLGIGDSTSIWFVQRSGREVRVIDYHEATGEGLPYYVKVLEDKGYIYSRHIAPFDIENRELGTGVTRKETASNLGVTFEVAPRVKIEDGIEAARSIIPRCWFDAEKTKRGLEALRLYRSDYDDRMQRFRSRPLHDWTSHAADAFRYGAVAGDPVGSWGNPIEYPDNFMSIA